MDTFLIFVLVAGTFIVVGTAVYAVAHWTIEGGKYLMRSAMKVIGHRKP